MDSRPPWAVYVHIPFCVRRCAYCDFATEAIGRDPHARFGTYLAALHAEIDSAPPRPASTVYFGGGTPTVLEAEQLAAILDHLRGHGGIEPGAEITIEANPTTAEAGKFAALRAAGFNRLSMGVQSFSDRLLHWLGRVHDSREAVRAYEVAREAGFGNVSLDLMFGLPELELRGWRRALDRAISLGPEHLSVYGLTIEEGTPLHARVAAGRERVCTELREARQYALAIDHLTAAGYEHYEIANFARPGRRSRHNQAYWRNDEYRGYGCGAASYVARARWVNVAGAAEYAARVRAGEDPAAEREDRDPAGERSDAMFLGLRLLDGVDAGGFARRYGVGLEEAFGPALQRLQGRGLLANGDGRWRLTREGLFLANQVMMEFV